MNKDIFEGKWEEVKGKMKQLWGKLTDDDLKKIEGNQQEIFGKLQKHYGYSEDEAKKVVKEFQHKNHH
ncbi:CsbD family protein [Legionella sp.]|uniref:CsbD family protein n=1 Tax=Legionella sp. TaxID=459 RepID=UPI003CB86D71